jgi:hypothetical protein
MLPPPEWRDERVPGLRYLESALGIAGVFVFAAFDGKRPTGFVSGYRFPSLTKGCDLVYIYDAYAGAWIGADLDNQPAHRLFVGSGTKSHAGYI